MPSERQVVLQLRLPPDLHADVKALAIAAERSLNQTIVRALRAATESDCRALRREPTAGEASQPFRLLMNGAELAFTLDDATLYIADQPLPGSVFAPDTRTIKFVLRCADPLGVKQTLRFIEPESPNSPVVALARSFGIDVR